MGFRFRKRINILPGVKLNISNKGISSVSIGKSGATVNLSKKGTRTTIGVPGTGVSYSKYQPHRTKAQPQPQPQPKIAPTTQRPDYLSPESTPNVKNKSTAVAYGWLILFGICCFLIGVIFF